MVGTRVFAHAFKVLAAKYWYIRELFTLAAGLLTVDLPSFDIIMVVSFELMSAEAARCWTDRPTVLACFLVTPRDVEPILACFLDFILVGFELDLTHHFTVVSTAHDLLILNVGLDMLCGLTIHY